MKIFIDRVVDQDYQSFIWVSGDHYLLSLYGINLDVREGDVYVEPIYRPRFTITRGSGTLFTVRIWKEVYCNILTMKNYPFVHIYTTKAISLDIEEEE